MRTATEGTIAMALEELGSLIIRVTLGLLFVVSAYVCSKDAGARKAATADAALVFPWHPEWFTLAGVLWMLDRRLVGAARHFPPPRRASLTLFLIFGGDDPFPQGHAGAPP